MFSVAVAADALLTGSIMAVLYRGRSSRDTIHSVSTAASAKDDHGPIETMVIYGINSGKTDLSHIANC